MQLINYVLTLSLATTLAITHANALPLGDIDVHLPRDLAVESGPSAHRRFGLFWPVHHSPFPISGRDRSHEATSTDGLVHARHAQRAPMTPRVVVIDSASSGKSADALPGHDHLNQDNAHTHSLQQSLNGARPIWLPRSASMLRSLAIGRTETKTLKQGRATTAPHTPILPRFSSVSNAWVIGKASLAVNGQSGHSSLEHQLRRSEDAQAGDSQSIARAEAGDGLEINAKRMDNQEKRDLSGVVIKQNDGVKLVERDGTGGEGGE